MPEGPEVHVQADSLHTILIGKTITALTLGEGWLTPKRKAPANYATFCEALPLTVTSVTAKGKKILFNLSNDYTILSYLGMEGKWTIEKRDHSHITLQCEDGTTLWYDDSRHFGNLEFLCSIKERETRLAELGPCLVKGGVTVKEWVTTLRAKRLQPKQIAAVLMSQEIFSGIGNYIKAEVLYASRIRPNATVGSLSDEHLTTLYTCTQQVIQASYAAQGATLSSYLHVDGSKGGYKVVVYDKKTDPDGNRVATNYFHDDRLTHWVPAVQVIPSPYVALELDYEKLEGKVSYLASEVRDFCHRQGLKCEGTKGALVQRLLAKRLTTVA